MCDNTPTPATQNCVVRLDLHATNGECILKTKSFESILPKGRFRYRATEARTMSPGVFLTAPETALTGDFGVSFPPLDFLFELFVDEYNNSDGVESQSQCQLASVWYDVGTVDLGMFRANTVWPEHDFYIDVYFQITFDHDVDMQ